MVTLKTAIVVVVVVCVEFEMVVTVLVPPAGVGGGCAALAVTFCVVLPVALGGTAVTTVTTGAGDFEGVVGDAAVMVVDGGSEGVLEGRGATVGTNMTSTITMLTVTMVVDVPPTFSINLLRAA